MTNERAEAPEDVARRDNNRAGIEPLIGEFKHGWGIGKVPSQSFAANTQCSCSSCWHTT